ALRLQAEVASPRVAACPSGDFLTVDPETDFAVDAANVVVIPLADALAQVLRGKAALFVGRGRCEGGHLRRSDGEDVAIGREPVSLLAVLLLELLRESVVEDLDLDTPPGQRAGLNPLQRLF